MIIIGERINSTRFKIKEAIASRDASYIIDEAEAQIASGASYVDVNCAVTNGDEIQDMDWLISVIQSKINDVSICIDSPNHLAIERALQVYKAKGSIFINSITGDEQRIKLILPLALKYNANLVALTMSEAGMPDTAKERLDIARSILSKAKADGMKEENIYFDPLIRPIATEPGQAREFLDAIPMIKSLGNVHTVCGLSNVSYGLPNRSLINSFFLSMAIKSGLDAAIMDSTDKRMLSSIYVSSALVGNDEYCSNYIRAFRESKLV